MPERLDDGGVQRQTTRRKVVDVPIEVVLPVQLNSLSSGFKLLRPFKSGNRCANSRPCFLLGWGLCSAMDIGRVSDRIGLSCYSRHTRTRVHSVWRRCCAPPLYCSI